MIEEEIIKNLNEAKTPFKASDNKYKIKFSVGVVEKVSREGSSS